MSNDKEKITSLLGDGEGQKMSKKKKMILGGVCIAVIAAFSWWMGSKETGPRYLTEAVTEGVLQVEVTLGITLGEVDGHGAGHSLRGGCLYGGGCLFVLWGTLLGVGAAGQCKGGQREDRCGIHDKNKIY